MKQEITYKIETISHHYTAIEQRDKLETFESKYRIPYKLITGFLIEGSPIFPDIQLFVDYYYLFLIIFDGNKLNQTFKETIKKILDCKNYFMIYLENKSSLYFLEEMLNTFDKENNCLTIDKEKADMLDDLMDAISTYTLKLAEEKYGWDSESLISKPVEIIILGGAIASINGGNLNQIIKITDLDE